MIVSRGKEGNQVTPSIPGDDVPRKNRFYALRPRGSKSDDEDDVCSYNFTLSCYEFFLFGVVW